MPAGEKALSSRLIKGEFIAKTNNVCHSLYPCLTLACVPAPYLLGQAPQP